MTNSKNLDSHLLTLMYDVVLEFLILTKLGDPWETGCNTDHQFLLFMSIY